MQKAIVLTYHCIGSPKKTVRLPGLYVTPKMFSFQMYYLKTFGYNVVRLNDILDFSLEKSLNSQMVAITFDDGFKSFLEFAYPVLQKYKFPATVFLVSSLIGKHNEWDSGYVNEKRQLMNWDDINFLKENAIDFGAHSRTHPSLTKLTDSELEAEIRGSKDDLESKLAMPIEFFCYPYGDSDNRVIESVKQAGFKGAFTTKKGYIKAGGNPYEFNRMSIKLNTGPLAFSYKLL
ncbi:polysaccharide deacetylase family protein [Candidatus Magnetomonas plexicatena]|uniref:polysaccharide deacetylase family protein n=1 Tax=Candidatus Magnetomonas plexicatena TaxID=2552947 RepID=UPI001C774A27|nr:polysaccharide deacetylase family protein [Nitrospirales bacterium LBB_01]